MTSETTAKKDIQKLQRAIVDGLEDVKAQDIVVFNTEKLSPLFERVIVASGTSNRQTKALAASVRDAVREAGFDKPRIEGEDNGEWIIVDCGAAVVHVMQPVIRQYYRLEEIWGATPVRLKHGAPKPAVAEKPAAKTSKRKAAAPVKAVAAKTVARTAAKSAAKTAAEAPVVKTGLKATAKPASKTAAVKTTAAKKTTTARKTATGTAAAQPKATLQKLVVNKPRATAKPAAKAAPKAAPKAAAKPAAKSAPKAAAKPAVKKKA
ncbi:MAG: ribosome silencing factor [Hydrogenophaga sp.]|jgi:ribosome-associated protein|uniref:ribosome silencing factor n=1 Tax=Comamonadaceae TaxID=80864 RepID=UPI002719EA3C|nr:MULTISPECIES: ribosome silencing factor [Comamonadaceae]MDO9481678.1 ribosome silencing factor [Hydrogenophaga sp.]MDP2093543.1 ribosome silencing factor [Hydrogenophaga sp.]MDP2164840.1 ribosome silencing factor [Hydrogenophaga sp.]MDP3344944.1 ribosome silencing factor [Hydrogenophaga sp.]MDP3798369.1 ribosome silencing factor [Polaromonas sp.]